MGEVLLPADARQEVERINPSYVTVVPDGALHELPLESMPTGIKPVKYILDSFPAIAYAPSVKIQAALEHRVAADMGGTLAAITVGNPNYPESDGTERSSKVTKLLEPLHLAGQLTALPATAKECEHVAHSFESVSGDARQVSVDRIEGDSATEKHVRQALANKQFVHLAAHGLVDQAHENLFGCIALTPPTKAGGGSDDDGFLFLYEIHQLPLAKCELAILSACQTNVGPERPLEAGSTMARAFLAAGARRVVSSHWSVEDESTAQLVGVFADEVAAALKQGQKPNYALALQKARRSVRENPLHASPYYWAPFVLIGPAQ
jgi:CHAT domain-containing protein